MNASRETGIRSFSNFWSGSTSPSMLISTFILCSTTTERTGIPEVTKWLAARPRYHVYFTPTSSSWLNQAERWFAEITRKRSWRGTFRSVRGLTKAIHDYIRIYNSNPRPFHWVASASRIIRKVNKYRHTPETADLVYIYADCCRA